MGVKDSKGIAAAICNSSALRQLLTFEDEPALLRAAPVGELCYWAGCIFDKGKLSPNTFDRSRQLQDHKIHTFVSHNWASSRWKKYCAVILHFNLLWGLCAALVVGVAAFAWRALTEASSWNGMLHVIVTPTMLLVTFLLRSWTAFCGLGGPSVFLDVCCIDQADQAQQRKGIEKLGAFMRSSDNLLVCYSPELYLKRLWTVYEVCTFLVVNQVKHMSIVPLDMPPFALTLCLVIWIGGIGHLGTLHLLFEGKPEELIWNLQGSSALAGLTVSCVSLTCALPARVYFLRLNRMLRDVQTFDVRTAECSCEEDREYVQASIIQLMRHVVTERAGEVSKETLLDEFNNHVRTEVPKAILYSSGLVGLPLKHLVILWGVPLTTVTLEIGAFFGLSDPLPVVAARNFAALFFSAWLIFTTCSRHPDLKGARHFLYMLVVVGAVTLILLVSIPPWDRICLIYRTNDETLQAVGHAVSWLRLLGSMVLAFCLMRPKDPEKAVATLELVPDPELDTFSL